MLNLSRRDLAKGAVSAMVATMISSRSLGLAKTRDVATDLLFVDPELRPFAQQVISGFLPELSQNTLAATRTAMSAYARPPLAAPICEKRLIAGPAGAPDVIVYIINARKGASRPAILHTHGGGFIGGAATDSIVELQELALLLDCAIVTVEYRLAPETKFVGSVGDNYAALHWLHGHAVELGVNPKCIAVMGESAGGGHAALLALKARDMGEIALVAQILIYPMLDDRTGITLHPPKPIGTILWTEGHNRFGWHAFLGQTPGSAHTPATAVPARRTDLAKLPPTFIGVGSIDLFVDEDIAYARSLINAGVPTELIVAPGAFHGFDAIAAQTSVAKKFTAAKIDALRRAFATIA